MNEKVTLKVGDKFCQAWKGVENPITFEVLSIDLDNNSLRVRCSKDGYSHEEDWDDLDVTEAAFEVGEYKMIK